MIFIGIDLAWRSRNRSGGAVIRDNQLVAHSGTLGDNAEIIEFVNRYLAVDTGAAIGIDAPLRVPNATGARACDRDLSADWRIYEAGALPANRQILTYGKSQASEIRGEGLVKEFGALGFIEAAPLPQQGTGRYLCEVFPHPAHVSFFQLEKTLKYKAKAGRTIATRRAEFVRYRNGLAALTKATPPLFGTADLLTQDLASLRGKELKAYEDTLDAVTCAYATCYFWHHGPAKTCTYGTVLDGHILTPPLPDMATIARL